MRRARAARSPRAGRRPWARPRAPDGSPTPPSSPGAHPAPSRASRPPIRLQPRFSSRGLGERRKPRRILPAGRFGTSGSRADIAALQRLAGVPGRRHPACPDRRRRAVRARAGDRAGSAMAIPGVAALGWCAFVLTLFAVYYPAHVPAVGDGSRPQIGFLATLLSGGAIAGGGLWSGLARVPD